MRRGVLDLRFSGCDAGGLRNPTVARTCISSVKTSEKRGSRIESQLTWSTVIPFNIHPWPHTGMGHSANTTSDNPGTRAEVGHDACCRLRRRHDGHGVILP